MNKILVLCILLLAHSAVATELTGKEIMQRNEDARKLGTVTAEAKLTTGGGDSPERIKEFTWWKKLLSDNTHYNTLTRFHAPAEVRGEGILFLEHEQDQNDVLMYLPAFKKIRRVESDQQSSSFMGSEFSYSNIATPHIEDYSYKLIKREACPLEEDKAMQCYVVESTPVNDEIKDRNGYARSIAWVRTDNFMDTKVEFYRPSGALWKYLEESQIKEIDQTKHKWMSHSLHMENKENNRFTTLQFTNVVANKPIVDSTFSQQNLSREK